MLLKHLPRVDDDGSKATCARLLSSATGSYIASIEVARHGFPRQYGALARIVVETLATTLALVTNRTALEDFHSGKLQSTKCVTWSKNTLPILAPLWGELSNEFVHIRIGHSRIEIAKRYTKDDESLKFVASSLLSIVLLFHIVTELVYSDEIFELKYWKRSGGGVVFDPASEANEWIET